MPRQRCAAAPVVLWIALLQRPARAPESGVAAAPVVVRTGPLVPASVAVQGDGAAVVTHRESGAHGGARVVVTRVTCRR